MLLLESNVMPYGLMRPVARPLMVAMGAALMAQGLAEVHVGLNGE